MVVMEKEPDIPYFSMPLCPKCAAMRNTLEAVAKEKPVVTIKEFNLLTNLGRARGYDCLSIPAIVVRGTPIKCLVSKETIIGELEKRG